MSWEDILKDKKYPYLVISAPMDKEGWYVEFADHPLDEADSKREGLYPPEQYGRRSIAKLATMLFNKYPSYNYIHVNKEGIDSHFSRDSMERRNKE